MIALVILVVIVFVTRTAIRSRDRDHAVLNDGADVASPNRAWEYLPIIPAVAAAVTLLGYVRLMRQQGDDPVAWFAIGLGIAACGSMYGAWPRAPFRAAALAIAGTILVAWGVLALLSVGLPLLIAGGVALVAATRAGGRGALAVDEQLAGVDDRH